MSDEEKEEKSVVDEAKERYERAKSAYSRNRQLGIEDTRFALGDSDNGWQWPEDIRLRRQADQRVCLTVNVTSQHCNQVINAIRQNRPSARVLPADSFADKRTAELLAGLCRNIQTSSNADDAHDNAAEHAIYGGEGYWRVITEYESEASLKQCIRIKPCPNPLLVYIDPDTLEFDKSDAGWGFVFEDISKEQAKREHPGIEPTSWIEDSRGWVTKDTVRRAEYFYCEYVDDEALLLEDGREVLASEYVKLLEDGREQPANVVDRRKTQRKQWKWCKLLGSEDKPVDEREWPGKFLPIIAVIGKETNVDGEVVRKGIVRDLKDPARMVNFSYSEAVQTISLQNKIPYLAAAEAIEGHEDQWAQANTSNDAYLKWNAWSDDGNQLPKPERQMPAVMPAAQVEMLKLSSEQMRAASGQQNANFGIRSEANSGIGIQRLKAQGEVATFHFPDNLARALRYEMRVLIDLIPKVMDTRRIVRILGLDGKIEEAMLDPESPEAFAEIQAIERDVSKLFNPSLGRYDVVIDTGPSYQTQRQEAWANLTELAGRNPKLMDVAGDLVMRAADFPMAEQLAERLAKTLPPGLADEEGQAKVPPQVQAQLAQMQQRMDQMAKMLDAGEAELQRVEAENEQLKAKDKADADKNEIDAYRAETERLQALAPAISQEQVQAIVQQTVAEIMGPAPLNEDEALQPALS